MAVPSELKIIYDSLNEAAALSKDPSFLEVCGQIPLRPDYQINFSNYAYSSHTVSKSAEPKAELTQLRMAYQALVQKKLKPKEYREDLFELNALVTGAIGPSARQLAINQPYPFPDPSVIDAGLGLLMNFSKDSSLHPLIKNIGFIQGLISVHPFKDGNHRTARLILDCFLIEHQFPATTITRGVDMIFANPSDRKLFSLEHAVQSILHAMGETLKAT